MSSVAERISIRLERVGLTAHAASLAAGLSRSAITDILAGNSNSPRLDTLEKLCGPLQCSIHDLVSDEPRPADRPLPSDHGPAFPGDSFASQHNPGMTLRDWFAGQALTGVLASEGENMTGELNAAVRSYKYADAMLAERAKAVRS